MIRKDDRMRGSGQQPEPIDPKAFRELIDRQRHGGENGRGRGLLLSRRRALPTSKEQVVARIRDSFEDLTDVLGAIDAKIDAHNRTSEKLESSVRHLPELMEGLPVASQVGVQILEDLKATLGTQTSLTRDVVDSVEALALRVSQIPEVLERFDARLARQEDDQQRTVDALVTLQTTVAQMHAESSRLQRQTHEQLAATLQQDREAARLALAADRQAAQQALDADRAVLSQVIERGNRQSMVLTVVLIVVVIAAAVTVVLVGA